MTPAMSLRVDNSFLSIKLRCMHRNALSLRTDMSSNRAERNPLELPLVLPVKEAEELDHEALELSRQLRLTDSQLRLTGFGTVARFGGGRTPLRGRTWPCRGAFSHDHGRHGCRWMPCQGAADAETSASTLQRPGIC